MPDIRIVPANAIMSFTSSLNFIERITQDPSGSLNLYGSGSTGRTELLSVDGNNGRLFTVSDDLSDSLFSVNTIAGLPVIEAFADNSVNIGQYSAPPIRVIGANAIITGSLFGTATQATNAVNISFNLTSNNANYPIAFSLDNNAGNKRLYLDTGLGCYVNPATDTIGATTFVGAFSGNASTATTASYATLAAYATEATTANSSTYTEYVNIDEVNTNASYQVLFVPANSTGYLRPLIDTDDAHLTYNPSTHVLTAGTFSGALSGNASTATTATNATNVAITTQDTTPVTYNLTFTGGTSGNNSLNVDTTTLTYNPGTGIFSTPIVNSTTAVRGGNGSATAPAFSFSGDTNTGMYSIGGDSLGFSTGGTARMSINSSGNVGIGTTSPSTSLEVFGDSFSVLPSIKINHNVGILDTYLELVADAFTGTKIVTGGNYATIFYTVTGGETMRITGTGRLGVGNSSPSYPLHVSPQVSNVSIYADYDIVAYSDKSVKENIRPIDNALERVIESRGILYDRIDSGEKDNIGFIAQELEIAFPELVVTNPDGTKAVKYQNAVAVLFEAVKDQQKQIDEIKQIINGITR